MKLVRFQADAKQLIGVVKDDTIMTISGRFADIGDDMCALISQWDSIKPAIEAASHEADYKVADVHLLAPVGRPGKIMAIGLNYASHVAEATMARPEHQLWFSKAVTSVNGPYDPIQLPIVSDKLDYEAEMVAVIGKGGRHIPQASALDNVFGYAVGNDVTVRDWQKFTAQWTLGKSFDTHAPFGPFLVTADEVNLNDMGIRCFVNGEKRQDSNTRHLLFPIDEQVSHLSKAMTLEPGDVLFTGTPGGVGLGMKPPVFLKEGDKVRVEIDTLGYIENEVVKEK